MKGKSMTEDQNQDRSKDEIRIESNSPRPRFNLRDKIIIVAGLSVLGIYLIIASIQFFSMIWQ
jgi:hypothetical protein